MKQFKKQLRLYIAEKLMSWAFSVAPYDHNGDNVRNFVIDYFNELDVSN